MDLVLDKWFTYEAMASSDHGHDFESLDRSGSRLHRLKATGRPNDSLECAVVCFDDAVQVFAGAMLRIGSFVATLPGFCYRKSRNGIGRQ